MLHELFTRCIQWLNRLPPILANATPSSEDEDTLLIVKPGRVLSWFMRFIPVGEEITREEAAALVLSREIRVRYTPLIVELDRKVHNAQVEVH